jgi:hypothetical protein
VSSVFTFPIDGEDPPSAAVIEQLKAVYTPRERFLVFGVPRFIGAPDMSDVVPLLHAIRH